ncbi:RagB/SusD family nutrient uptake outer membrane protein [Flavisolibacter nicotianae]|uniref:RagB/SusD family nutrient uptake outer membrane protein n=1 Tax=Flavisolibacter nicotianae TaxID=2364882 RepID=UPI000EB4D8C1|nr:RagB/SusD family nutrient uptake outer membrane protein [Flavisolibacter nicotianae]
MKNIAIAALLLFLLGSCKKEFIDLNPPSNLNSAGFYKTESDMNQAVLSAYGNLRSVYNNPFIRLGEIRSDNTTYSWLAGNPADDNGIDVFASPLLPENGYPTSAWNNCYNVILRCNIVIGRIEGVSFKNEQLKKQYIGEAKFLRALMYFWLNRVFGGYSKTGALLGVLKVDKEVSPAESYEIARSSLQENYDFIVSDLKYAEENLPAAYGATDKGRVTKWGAKGLLTKVYMTMAGYPLNKGVEYYNLAIQKAEEVINTSGAALVPSYRDLFDVNKKNSVESLFEVQYKKGSPNGVTGSPWNNDFAPRFSDKEVVLVGDKGGVNAPTGDMSGAYETGDPRKYVSMRDFWINAKNGAVQNERYVTKYYDVATSGSDNGNNWIELRLADIYLLEAEALVRTGGSKATALLYVNKIRQRARNTQGDPNIPRPANLLKDYTVADFANDDELLLAIEKERRVELAFENHRWFDLVRTGRAKNAMMAEQAADGYPAFTWSDDMLSYPIPMTVMQSNPGKIIQNKGYVQL